MMKTNDIHWIRQVLTWSAAFCLVINLDIHPVQASSPPDNWRYNVFVYVLAQPFEICLHEPTKINIQFGIRYLTDSVLRGLSNPSTPEPAPLVKLGRGRGNISITIKGNTLDRSTFELNQAQWDKIETTTVTYTATKEGQETMDISFAVEVSTRGNWLISTPHEVIFFDVIDCELSFHGGDSNLGVNATRMAQAMGANYVEYIGTYDISGQFKIEQDGIHGEGQANIFMDIFQTGPLPNGGTCTFSPLEGSSAIDVDGDRTDTGMVTLRLNQGSLSLGKIQAACSDGGGGTLAPYAIDALVLPSDAVASHGGRTNLYWNGVPLELIISPQEAES